MLVGLNAMQRQQSISHLGWLTEWIQALYSMCIPNHFQLVSASNLKTPGETYTQPLRQMIPFMPL